MTSRVAAGPNDMTLAADSWRAQHGRAGGRRNADAEVIDDVTRGVGRRAAVPRAGLRPDEPIEVVASPGVTHVKYRVGR